MTAKTHDEEARLVMNADGSVEGASPAAERLLGATLAELRAAPVGTFSPEPPDDEAAAAFRVAWDRAGAGPIAGHATVRRLDGTLQRVRYVIASREDGRFEAVLEPITANAKARPTAFVIGQVLTAWREAERRLERLDPGSSESRAVEAEIDELREQYQDLFQAKRSA